jgi:RNA methyltransferase, TrmH family
MKGEVGTFCRVLAGARKPYRQVATEELARIAGTMLHGGVVAVTQPQPVTDIAPPSARDWAQDGKPLIILDRIGNPHNLGAIVRSAAFFGLERIILADHPEQAMPSDASYRVAEGGFEYVEICRAPPPGALNQLREAYRVVGSALGQGPMPARWSGGRPVALVLGNEETGLDPATLAACDEVVTIPGSGRTQSLNVAAAAAVLLYCLTRSCTPSRDPEKSAISSSSRLSSTASISAPAGSRCLSTKAAASSVESAARRGSRRRSP